VGTGYLPIGPNRGGEIHFVNMLDQPPEPWRPARSIDLINQGTSPTHSSRTDDVGDNGRGKTASFLLRTAALRRRLCPQPQ
jgi:hypothetical protein